MKYSVEYTDKAVRSLKKLDKPTLIKLKSWIEKNLVGTEDPRQHGKGLTGDKSGYWRYRIGDYRILADIQNETVTILVVNVGHRRDIYK